MSNFKRLQASVQPEPIPNDAPAKWLEASFYTPSDDLVTALEVAIALRQPLLLTGEPGSGKTGAAYWASWRLGLRADDLIHVQVRSDASAARLKYEFDAVKYFRESQVMAARNEPWDEDRERFIQPGPLWQAFTAARERPVTLLLDEIDKAPRDFPNDLLHEFDALEFEVPDWPDGKRARRISARGGPGFALVVFTSNGERRLPDAFLRRCVHHHLRFDAEQLSKVIQFRINKGDLRIDPGLVDFAVQRFVALKGTPGLQHRPGLAELLVWLRVIAMAGDVDINRLENLRLGELPYLGTLLKEPADRDLIGGKGA